MPPRQAQYGCAGRGQLSLSCCVKTGQLRIPKIPGLLSMSAILPNQRAISARNVAEFIFNLRLVQRIEVKLKAEGFADPVVRDRGQSEARSVRRVNAANNMLRESLSVDPSRSPDNRLRTGNSRARSDFQRLLWWR
jgi:hypothetical protein